MRAPRNWLPTSGSHTPPELTFREEKRIIGADDCVLSSTKEVTWE
jgi:hypothetical protein